MTSEEYFKADPFNLVLYDAAILLNTHFFKAAFHGLVSQQGDRAHKISHKDEVPFGFEIKSNYVVEVTALHPQFFVSCPFKQPHLQCIQILFDGNVDLEKGEACCHEPNYIFLWLHVIVIKSEDHIHQVSDTKDHN